MKHYLSDIHSRIIKELAAVFITKPLSMFFEQSWDSKEVPADWKLSNVPVFKKVKNKEPINYRTVCLTSVPSKTMTKIILGSLEKYPEDTVIGHSQHFMREKSCLSNSFSSTTGVQGNTKYYRIPYLSAPEIFTVSFRPCGTSLDFSKGFDTVSHRILLDKMSRIQLDNHVM